MFALINKVLALTFSICCRSYSQGVFNAISTAGSAAIIAMTQGGAGPGREGKGGAQRYSSSSAKSHLSAAALTKIISSKPQLLLRVCVVVSMATRHQKTSLRGVRMGALSSSRWRHRHQEQMLVLSVLQRGQMVLIRAEESSCHHSFIPGSL